MYMLAIFLEMLLPLLGVLTIVGLMFVLLSIKNHFFILSVRIFIALLMFPFFISCENLLDISARFADVSLDLKFVSFRNSFLDSFRNTVAVGANRIVKNVAIAVQLKCH